MNLLSLMLHSKHLKVKRTSVSDFCQTSPRNNQDRSRGELLNESGTRCLYFDEDFDEITKGVKLHCTGDQRAASKLF